MDAQQKQMAEELIFKEDQKPSFAKMLFFGVFDAKRILPFPKVSPEEEKNTDQFIRDLKVFMDQSLDPDWIDRHAEIPDSVIKGLGKLGILSMTIGKEYGGMGTSQYAYCQAMENIARRCAATALFINAHQSVGMKALLLYGTDKQKNRWLKELSKGDRLAAFSLTEPNAGSDASAIETKAVFDPQKKVWIINGQKQWTTNGSVAHILTVMAKTSVDTPKGPQDKVTAFLVTPDMPGFKVKDASLEKVGMRGSITSNLTFENLEVPEENVLGPIGHGLKVCLTVLDYGRITFGATCTGAAKFLLQKAIEHARNRKQFKKQLAAFPLIKQKIAYIGALSYAMEAATYLTAGLLDKKDTDIMVEAAILKVFTSESLWKIVYETMQIYGGRSFFTDQPLERMMRDARLNMIGEGANEVLRVFIGVVGMRDVGMLMKEAKEVLQHPIDNFSSFWALSKLIIKRLNVPDVPLISPLIQQEGRVLGGLVRKFGIGVMRLLIKYRESIVDKQLLVDRIAESAIHLYVMSAVLSKLDSDLAIPGQGQIRIHEDLAKGKLFINVAASRVKKILYRLTKNNDHEWEEVADKLTGYEK